MTTHNTHNTLERDLYRLFGRSAVSYSGPGADGTEVYSVEARLPKNWTSKWFPAYVSGFTSMSGGRSSIRLGARRYVFLAWINEATP